MQYTSAIYETGRRRVSIFLMKIVPDLINESFSHTIVRLE